MAHINTTIDRAIAALEACKTVNGDKELAVFTAVTDAIESVYEGELEISGEANTFDRGEFFGDLELLLLDARTIAGPNPSTEHRLGKFELGLGA